LGLDPRSRSEREEYRALLWESLQLFARTLVVGEVKGTYKDRKGSPISFIEKSPVIAITGTKYSSEMRLDGSETPVAVEYTWAAQTLAQMSPHASTIAALQTMRRVQSIITATIVSERRDIRRFRSIAGRWRLLRMVRSEERIGGKVRRGGITKAANAHLRRAIVSNSLASSS
jgi:hypothetical protein